MWILQGSFIPVVVDLTANHQGYFEFKICPNDDIFQDPDQVKSIASKKTIYLVNTF